MRQSPKIGFYYVYFGEPAYRWPFTCKWNAWFYMAYNDVHTFKQE